MDTPTSSRAVAWLPVHDWVRQRITNPFPMAGTPAWCGLDDDDPVKMSAVLDAGQHWILRIEGNQEALAEASKDISSAADWPAVSRELAQLNAWRAKNPWSKRSAS